MIIFCNNLFYLLHLCNRYNQQDNEKDKDNSHINPLEQDEIIMSKRTAENISNQVKLCEKLEFIEQKLMKLQSLKDDTLNEFSSILTERNFLINRAFNFYFSKWTCSSFE